MRRTGPRFRPAAGALSALLAITAGVAADPEPPEEEIELERSVELEVRLLRVEPVPFNDALAIARFRVVDGEYRGSLLSLAYETAYPVRLRQWDVHDVSGYTRIGGGTFGEAELGRWDWLLRPGTNEPMESLALTLVQHDLNGDEERRRWHFKRIEAITPLYRYDPPDPARSFGGRGPVRPDR